MQVHIIIFDVLLVDIYKSAAQIELTCYNFEKNNTKGREKIMILEDFMAL